MKMKKWFCLALSILMLLSLAGCGAATAKDFAIAETYASNGNAPMDMDYSAEAPMSPATAGNPLPQARKWIVTVDIRTETEDMDALLEHIGQQIAGLNGYIERQDIHNGSTYSNRRYRSASLTIRIPAEQADSFTSRVGEVSNVVSHNKQLEDVTLNYVATESRMKALQAEEARLLELMTQAETMADLLEIESRLTDIRYELERVTSQLRVYDNLVDYATINLHIEEVQEYTPVAEKTIWQRIGDGFMESLEGIGNFFVELFVFLLVGLPYFLLIGAVVFVIVLLCKRSARKRRAKRAACPPPYQPYPPQNYPAAPPAQKNPEE